MLPSETPLEALRFTPGVGTRFRASRGTTVPLNGRELLPRVTLTPQRLTREHVRDRLPSLARPALRWATARHSLNVSTTPEQPVEVGSGVGDAHDLVRVWPQQVPWLRGDAGGGWRS